MALVPAVTVNFVGPSPCHLDVTVTVLITGESGHAMNVDGNPQSVHVVTDLPMDSVNVSWFWTNWCGQATMAVYQVTVGDVSAMPSPGDPASHGTPVCNDRNLPSQLSTGTMMIIPVSPSP